MTTVSVPVSLSLTIDGVAVPATGTAQIDPSTLPAGPPGTDGAPGTPGVSPSAASVEALLAADPNFIKAVAAAVSVPVPLPLNTFDYYISPTGDDNNSGSISSPWSITGLKNNQGIYGGKGKRIGIIGDVGGVQTPLQTGRKGGVATTLYSVLSTQQNQPVIPCDGGLPGSPTVLASCTSAGVYAKGWAIIDAANPSGGAHAILDTAVLMGQNSNSTTQVPHPDNITYMGLVLRNFSYCAIAAEATGGARMTNVIAKDCEFYGSNTAVSTNNPGCFRLDNTTGAQFINCLFHDCQTVSSGSFYPYAYPGIMSYNSTAVTLTNCEFYNIISLQQKDATQDAVISYCYMDSGAFGATGGGLSYGSSYYMGVNAAGRKTIMHHNIILGMIVTRGATGSGYAGDWEFYNNTCYPTDPTNPILYLQPNPGSTFHAYNNVMCPKTAWGTEYGGVKFPGASAALAPQFDYNYYLANPKFWNGAALSYAQWQALGFDAHSKTGVSPFAGTPVAQKPTSFALNTASLAYSGGIGGAICGALDGSGTVGLTS